MRRGRHGFAMKAAGRTLGMELAMPLCKAAGPARCKATGLEGTRQRRLRGAHLTVDMQAVDGDDNRTQQH